MTNEEKNKVLKRDGIPVHFLTFWDMYSDGIIGYIFIWFLICYFMGSAGAKDGGDISGGFVIGIICALIFFPFYYVLILAPKASNKNQFKGESIFFNCVHCGSRLFCSLPGKRINCEHCKKDNGYFNGKVYKITKENKRCFQTDEEITNDILEKKLKQSISNDKSTDNLKQIKELKELLDMGAITQEEFDEKKKELLK